MHTKSIIQRGHCETSKIGKNPNRLFPILLDIILGVRPVSDYPSSSLLLPLILTRGCSTATAGDVLVLHGSTRVLVNLLPAHLTGELLAELDAHRCAQTALALVGVHHLDRGQRHIQRALLVTL